jgi:hypothetical protein
MAIEYKSWVSETGTLTGTDPTYTLPGTASTPSGNQFFRKVSTAFSAAATVVLTLTAATGAETSVWTYTPGASGAPGTITRVTLLESSTGSAINWSGVTANISGDIPAPASVSLGAASAGIVPALQSYGQLDPSLQYANSQTPSGGVTLGSPIGYANAIDTFNLGNNIENVGNLNGWANFWLYRWRGPKTITSCSVYVNSSGTSPGNTYSLGIMSIGSSQLTLMQTVTVGGFSDASTGINTVSGLNFDLPQGDYVLQMVYSSQVGGGSFINQSARAVADSPNFGWSPLPYTGFLHNAGQSTLLSSFSGSPNGGLQTNATFPKVWFNGTN